jgi:hypothetical protein
MRYDNSTIRLLNTDTVPAGTGMLIAPGYLLTCTHGVVPAQCGG